MLICPMRTLGISLGMAQRAIASGARMFEILDRAARHRPGRRAAAAGGQRPRRAARRDLRLRGRASRPLHDVSLDVPAGTTVALVGATGSGKTTLAPCCRASTTSTAGAVLIDGADVRDVDPASLRRAIAVVDDDPFLFSATVADNIAYARRRTTSTAPRSSRPPAARRPTSSSRGCPTATTRASASAG